MGITSPTSLPRGLDKAAYAARGTFDESVSRESAAFVVVDNAHNGKRSSLLVAARRRKTARRFKDEA
jgi:hypothetical protein